MSQFPDTATSVIDINGQQAVVAYEADINAFRGKFLNVNGYCDFVSTSIEALHHEGEIALNEWLQDCKEDGVEPFREQVQRDTDDLHADD